jgi:alpha/beta superfamily hydrolase
MKPTLARAIIQGEADTIARPVNMKLLQESLASRNKSVRAFADADHYFYDAVFPKMSSMYDLARAIMKTDIVDS